MDITMETGLLLLGTYYIVGSGLTTKMDDVSLYDTNGNRVGHVYTLIQAAGFQDDYLTLLKQAYIIYLEQDLLQLQHLLM